MNDSSMKILADDLHFPEGPVVMPDGSIMLVEIARGTLTRIAPNGCRTIAASLGGGPNGAALGPDGRVYVCNNGGVRWHRDAAGFHSLGVPDDYAGGWIEVVEPETGRHERLYDRVGAHRLTAPNDLVFAADGSFWFTDLGKRRARDHDFGGVYWAKADGSEIREVIHPMHTPNGIGLSPDGGTLYVAEAHSARIWAYDVAGPGELRKLADPSPHGGRCVAGMGGFQQLDSLKVTSSGRICAAAVTNGGLWEVWPDGSHAVHHPLPDSIVTNLCFAGPELRTAYVTLSRTGRLAALDWHEPGLKLNFQADPIRP